MFIDPRIDETRVNYAEFCHIFHGMGCRTRFEISEPIVRRISRNKDPFSPFRWWASSHIVCSKFTLLLAA